jgi:hypothetical protein
LDDMRIFVMLVNANLLGLEGNVEAEVVAAWKEPVANDGIDPVADAANDLRNARLRDAEDAGDVALLAMASNDEAVDIEAAGRRNARAVHLVMSYTNRYNCSHMG